MNKYIYSLFISSMLILFISCEDVTDSQIQDINSQSDQNFELKDSNYDTFHLSSNCDDVVIGSIEYENSAEEDIEITICEDDSAGELDDINLGLGSVLLITSVQYSQGSLNLPSASFETNWTGNTEWYYYNGTEGFFDTSDNQATATIFNDGGQTFGSEFVELENLSLTKDLNPPNAPTLTTSNGADLKVYHSLQWQEPGGGPSVEYDVKITGSSYNQTYPTSSTSLPLAGKGLETGETYSWKVRGINAEDEEGAWSQTRTFTIIPAVTINGPTQLTEIYDGSLGQWTASVDGGDAPYSYDWEGRIACRPGFTCNPYHGNWINIGSGGNEAAWLFSDNDNYLDIRLTVTDDNDVTTDAILFSINYYPDI